MAYRIKDYLLPMLHDEWTELPDWVLCSPAGVETMGWLHPDGIQLVTSIKDVAGFGRVIHTSLAPMYSIRRDIRREDLEELVAKRMWEILKEFFGDRPFDKQPDDPRMPDMKHFFSGVA